MLEAETQLGRYRIVRRLGAGGMADVYEAEDTALERRVALKVLPPEFARDPERVRRFAKEVQACAALQHPNIVPIFEVAEDGGTPYFAMLLVEGGDLKARTRRGPLPPEEALTITQQVAAALGHAHERGFVHRDVKPENILFRDDGAPVLTDFGIAKAVGSSTRITRTGMSIGTPHYMSPEQARGKTVDHRSDLYGLGVVLFEMLTGRVPYAAEDTFAVGLMHISDPIPELGSLLIRYQPLVDNLLAKDPDHRYAHAGDLIAAIDRLLAGEDIAPPREVTEIQPVPEALGAHEPRPPPPPGRNRGSPGGLRWALGGAALAGLVVFAGYQYLESTAPVRSHTGGGDGASAEPESTVEELALEQERQASFQIREEEDRRRAAEAQRRTQEIASLLRAADQDLAANRLTGPAGANAIETYHKVLALDPENADAHQGLQQIFARFTEQFDSALGQNDVTRADALLQSAEQVFPESAVVVQMRARLARTNEALALELIQKEEAARKLEIERNRQEAERQRLAEQTRLQELKRQESLEREKKIQALMEQTRDKARLGDVPAARALRAQVERIAPELASVHASEIDLIVEMAEAVQRTRTEATQASNVPPPASVDLQPPVERQTGKRRIFGAF